MTSLQTKIKQIPLNAGYYIPVADCRDTFYVNNGTSDAPSFGQGISTLSTAGLAVSSLIQAAGAGVLRDMGQTLTSSTRVFRKVQILRSTLSLVNGGTDGVAGLGYGASATSAGPYLTGYIELPGTGDYSSGTGSFTPVARLG
jgi:hypothetical protein